MGEQVVDLYGVLRMNASGWTASIKAAGAEAETMAGKTKAGFLSLSKIGAGVAIGLAAITAASVKAASSFDSQMELVHTQAGASQAEVDKLKQAVLNLAPTVGQGPEQLAEGLYHVESAGFRGSTALNILRDAAKGAAIGHANLEAVTQAMIGTMAVGLKDVHGTADAMAYLNQIVGIGDMRMEKLAASIATGVLPSFKSAGLGLKDYGAALATLTDNVTPADEAATRLRMTVSLLAAPSGTAIKALKTIGIGSTDLANDLRKPQGLLVAVEDLKSHLQASGKTAAEQNQVIQKAFGGGRTSGAIMTLLGETDRLKSKYQELGTAGQRAGRYQDAWAQTQKQFSQQVHQLGAELQKLEIEYGQKIIPVLQAGAKWMEKHTTVVKALAALIGGALLVALAAWIASMAVLAVETILATWPILLIIAAVALLVVGILYLKKHWSSVWGEVRRIAGDVGHFVAGIWDWLFHRTTSVWHSITSGIGNAWHAIIALLHKGWDAAKSWAARMFPLIGHEIAQGIVHGLTNAGGMIANAAEGVAHRALDAAKSFLGIASPSKVFADQVGRQIPAGIAQGVNQHAGMAQDAVGRLTDGLAMQGAAYAGGRGGAGLSGSLAGGAAAAGAGTTVVVVNVAGSILAERDLMNLIRTQTQRYGRKNGATGLGTVLRTTGGLTS